ncbi:MULTISPECIES: hypothetical protein [Nostoc]|uniref:hypothetical protein n=1 Tax=Nostoc TaxID=1177 RepID=UPI001F558B1A|nr:MULTISPECIES: hypothetical protein [Nostoc]
MKYDSLPATLTVFLLTVRFWTMYCLNGSDSHETHQRNFEEHQRTTNAALQSLEGILIQLTKNRS